MPEKTTETPITDKSFDDAYRHIRTDSEGWQQFAYRIRKDMEEIERENVKLRADLANDQEAYWAVAGAGKSWGATAAELERANNQLK